MKGRLVLFPAAQKIYLELFTSSVAEPVPDCPGLDPESPLREFAEGIRHETERVANLVRNLLQCSRHEKQSHSPARMNDIVGRYL